MSGGVPSYPAVPLIAADRRPTGVGSFRRRLQLLPEVCASLLVGGLLLAAYPEPWWSIRLYAPQYPNGLAVDVLLSGARGDVREIDTLNHYIGMASLTTAAPLERQLALVGIVLAALVASALLLAPWRRAKLLGVAVVSAVPLGFVADLFYWMHRFGHDLDPRAPLKLEPFTPDLFGNGVIGQFMTFARPELGFWLAIAAAGMAAMIVFVRERRGEGGQAAS